MNSTSATVTSDRLNPLGQCLVTGFAVIANSFHSYQKDFVDMASSRKGDPAFKLLMYLSNTARSLVERLTADQAIISMYDAIQCTEDRARTRPYVSGHFSFDSKVVDFDLADANNAIAHIQIPGAAQMALQMKNDLRAAKEKLDTIATSLQ